MWVKICGTTTAEDARMAAEAGADAVGFVLVRRSRRGVGVAAVAAITRAMVLAGGVSAAVERVGVFDPEDYDEAAGVSGVAGAMVQDARAAGLTGVQVHGGGRLGLVEVAEAVRERAEGSMLVLPVVSWEVGGAAPGEVAAGDRVRAMLGRLATMGVGRVLVDSKVGAEKGGTGVRFPWEAAAAEFRGVSEGLELVVAGGLGPETVGEAVRVLRPWGVDVASGVEAAVGRKDPERVRAFVRAARG